jgi:hypothetical protein
MKKVALITSILSLYSVFTFAQESNLSVQKKKPKFGFSVGANYSSLDYSQNKLSENVKSKNGLGLRLGILAEYKLLKLLAIEPRAEISFNNTEATIQTPGNPEGILKVMPVNLEFISHFKIGKTSSTATPYLLFGPNLKIPLNKNNTYFKTNKNLALDIGIGLNKPLEFFRASPHFRYSYGIVDFNQPTGFPSTPLHSISLVLNLI